MTNQALFEKSPRPEKIFYDPSIYPFDVETYVRFQDIDMLGHINNAAMGVLFEDARVQFGGHLKIREKRGTGRILVGNTIIHYTAEAYMRPNLIFKIGVGHIGRSSWSYNAAAYQKDKCVAICSSTMVYTDENGSSAALPDALFAALESMRLNG